MTEPPDVRINQQKLTVVVRQLNTDHDSRQVFGKVLINANLYPQYEYGDLLEIDCELEMLGKFYEEVEATRGGIMKLFCGIFLGRSDETPKLNHELSECRKMSLAEIEEIARREKALFVKIEPFADRFRITRHRWTSWCRDIEPDFFHK